MIEMLDQSPNILHHPPTPDTVVPRDGRRILFSKDYHFITQTLETWSQDLSKLWEFQTAEDTTAGYFFEDQSGLFRHPLSGTVVEPPTGVEPGDSFSAPGALHRHLTEDFFYLRCLLTLRCRTDLTLSFRGEPLLHAGEPIFSAVDLLNAEIGRPIDEEDDPVLDHLATLRFPNAKLTEQMKAEDDKPICPLDGPVTPLRFGITTPMWTWKAWCGSSWEIHACPACLGELGSAQMAEE